MSTLHPTILHKSWNSFEYEDALRKRDYKVKVKQPAKTTAKLNKKKQRNRICFSPHLNKGIKTNVAKIFFRLVDKYFLTHN